MIQPLKARCNNPGNPGSGAAILYSVRCRRTSRLNHLLSMQYSGLRPETLPPEFADRASGRKFRRLLQPQLLGNAKRSAAGQLVAGPAAGLWALGGRLARSGQWGCAGKGDPESGRVVRVPRSSVRRQCFSQQGTQGRLAQ
jgi:hypothetical protein